MADPVPPVVDPPDLERIVNGDWRAVRDAIEKLSIGLNQEIVGRAQVLQPLLAAQLTALTAVVNTFVNAPTGLGASDAGLLFYCTDYNHVLRWSGSVWQFAPGDPGNRFFSLRDSAPVENGWAACTGAATDYLTVGGAALGVTAVNTPNPTDGTFLKRLAVYTGVIEAAVTTGTVGDAGATGDDMNLTSANLTAGAAPLAIASTSKFTHAHSPGAPKSLGLQLFYRR